MRRIPLLLLACAACSAPPPWRGEPLPALAEARAAGRPVAVYFALPGRELSDRMEAASLRAPEVLAALDEGGYASVRIDGFEHQRLYATWIGGGEGMGTCVLDEQGRVIAARPGPQDPPELAAWLRLVVERGPAIATARAAVERDPRDAAANHRLGVLLLEVGCRIGTEEVLVTAAQGGVVDAHHRLARLYALDGRLVRARQWLRTAQPSPAARVTEGYVLYKERRHREAVEVLGAAVREGGLGEDRQRALLFLGKALHQAGADDEARRVLTGLCAEATGSTFEGAALHALHHLDDPDHGHSH